MAAVSVGEKCTRTNRIANTACVYFFFNDLSNHGSLPWHPQMYINPPPPTRPPQENHAHGRHDQCGLEGGGRRWLR